MATRTSSRVAIATSLVAALLAFTSNPALGAGRQKSKLQKKLKNLPSVEDRSDIHQVLVFTVPEQKIDIPHGSTIAFIDFSHVGRSISRDIFAQSEAQASFSSVLADIKSDIYYYELCAAQIASALAQHLADLNRYRIVTREHIGSVLEEQYFSNSGSVDTGTAARLGELIGADFLIYGQAQLCVSSLTGLEQHERGSLAGKGSLEADLLSKMVSKPKANRPMILRSLVLAHIEIVKAESGEKVLSVNLRGEFGDPERSLEYEVSRRELIHKAATNLAAGFIGNLLARPEPWYVEMYTSRPLDFDSGIDLIQLGNCKRAEEHFRSLYQGNENEMSYHDIAKWMYNHSVALLCSNRPEEALGKLRASLRLLDDRKTHELIEFANTALNRRRRFLDHMDPVIKELQVKKYAEAGSKTHLP